MKFLELRIPPPVVAAVFAGLAWLIAKAGPAWGDIPGVGKAGAAVMLLGLVLDTLGLVVFLRARTTVNPLSPDKASAVVTTGIYRYTRNPMYLGMLLVLTGWAVYLAAPFALLAPAGFAAYITRFQIRPEEEILLEKFGEPYREYLGRVRRWL